MSTQDNINEIAKMIQKAMTAQEAASRGLVPQSGNPDKPGRWIKDPKAEGKSSEQEARSAAATTFDQLKPEFDEFFNNPKIQARIKNMNSEQRKQFTENIVEELFGDKGSSEPKSPNESIDMSDSWGRDSEPLSPNYKDFALPLNPYKTIDGKKYRVRGVRDSEKGQEAVIWADNQSYLIRKPKNGKWSKPIKTN